MKISKIDEIVITYDIYFKCGECGLLSCNTAHHNDNLDGKVVICQECGKYTKLQEKTPNPTPCGNII